jgi:hypothetical protein
MSGRVGSAGVVSVAGASLIGLACAGGDAASPVNDISPLAPAPVGAAASATTPTWYHDVEPIVQVECAGCHTATGPGAFPLDRFTTVSIGDLVAENVSRREMPPWPPNADGTNVAALEGARVLSDEAIATIVAWWAGGAPDGDIRDHVDRAPRVGAVPPGAPGLHLELADGDSYGVPANQFITDEVRCFVVDLPASMPGVWITAARWNSTAPIGIRAIGGVALDATAARAARLRERKDGRAGFECGGGFGDVPESPWIGGSGISVPGDGATILPAGNAVRLMAGGAILMRVHYAVKHLASAADRPSVDLWLASETERRTVRPLVSAGVAAPVEVPCPTGISLDPANACSRDNAFARLAAPDPTGARAAADARLAACGTTLAAATAPAVAAARATGTPSFLVSSVCASVVPWDGVARVVRGRMQTRGAEILVEAESSDGSWAAILDIPRWRWAFDSAYVLTQGVPVTAGKHLRVSCTFDNGLANQWSALTGEPGHDAPARPPVLAPGYLITAPNRAAEACEASIGIERTPFQSMVWPTLCHEAQAIHDDACSAAPLDLVSGGCNGADEDTAVSILALSRAGVIAKYCPAPATL